MASARSVDTFETHVTGQSAVPESAAENSSGDVSGYKPVCVCTRTRTVSRTVRAPTRVTGRTPRATVRGRPLTHLRPG